MKQNETKLSDAIKVISSFVQTYSKFSLTQALKQMIEDIARDPEKTFNLADTPLSRMSPAEINSVLEELGWYESECWFDDEYGYSTYTSNEWGFSLCMSFDGFEWSVHLYRGEVE